jgi:ABC-type lipoprotein release transport system permease subunit
MIQIFKMAFRDLGRNKRRTFFSALAVAVGLALLLLMASTIAGEMRGSMNTSIKLQSGHLQVRAASYDQNKTSLAWEDLIENPEQVAAKVTSLELVSVATPRLYASGIVTVGNESAGVRIIGIDPPSRANDPFREGLVAGSFLDPQDREGILIGQPLTEILHVKVGDQVLLLINTSNGDVDEQSFTIRGIYSTDINSFDESTVFLPLLKAQAFGVAENHASAIFVLLKDREQAVSVADAIKTTRYKVVTWKDMNSLLIATEQYTSGYMVLMYLIVLAISATVIMNTLIMSVYERTREIGILSAIGMKGRRILTLFLTEAILLALGGIALGLIVGVALIAYFTKFGIYIGNVGTTSELMLGNFIFPYLTIQDVTSLTIMTLVITILAGIYPAILAARMEPVDALRGK